ncbi:glycosyltransferase family 2 protein [Salinisphaera hydrothermalis]|uniref:Glycosyltransferase n=1 Tax=Salinisphaera hydrothermalis (strain C41B8) TaxID=1304275 RepID=A0A084IMD8_SALHC|nr:glycosyltransferase family A protein [Salinisphaera hydrothermalis]KEZ77872.1 glycosyltransferase [Salinisphaera hydrothermalis C41B8]
MSGTPPRLRYSIIVAAYNVADEIDTCLASLTAPSIADCEILVVDDGSTDDTRARIAAYEPDPRIRVIDKANGGLSDARNAGINAARGEYLMFVDGDDWVEPDLTVQFDAALTSHPEADLLIFSFYEVRDTQRTVACCSADFWRMTNSACNKLFARQLFDDVRFDIGIWYEDLAIVPFLFARARNPLTVDAVLYNYRRDRAASITNSVNVDRLYELSDSASRCIERILRDESNGRIPSAEARLGPDWRARFETVQIFIPGILHRSRMIEDRQTRQRYIAGMLRRLPNRQRVRLGHIRRQYGLKMAGGSLLYILGLERAGHFLLHDTGQLKARLASRLKGVAVR